MLDRVVREEAAEHIAGELTTCGSVLPRENYTIIFPQRPLRGKTLLAL